MRGGADGLFCCCRPEECKQNQTWSGLVILDSNLFIVTEEGPKG